jgi:hypothetical protein
MRIRLALISLTAVLAIVAAGASAGAASHPKAAARGHATHVAFPDALSILYNQNSNDSGVGIVSQDFTDSGFDIYDSNGADDFVVPANTKWLVKGVIATGVYFGCVTCGPATSETVTFYKDAGNTPGAAISVQTVTGADSGGTFKMLLPTPVKLLTAGKYWISVQATLNFAAGGEWAWETTNTLSNTASKWQNPGDGFGTGCTTYMDMQTCIGPSGEGPDFMFALAGQHQP